MSRVGRQPIPVPEGVKVDIVPGQVRVTGPKGTLEREIHPSMTLSVVDDTILVERPTDSKLHRSLHGLTRNLIANMITGVTSGFVKTLEVTGIGYRIQTTGDTLTLHLGFSHPIEVKSPPGVEFEVEPAPRGERSIVGRIHVKGIDKEMVGEIAARIRAFRRADPYKAKGIKYEGEWIRRKAGKAGAV
jgi:large subunit ribosomal protein L6